MSLRLRLTARAAGEIDRAERWWQRNRLAVPDALWEDLRAAFAPLVQRPDVGVKVAGMRLHGTRRLHLDRIRYYIYYRVKRDDLVILSFWHSSRARGPHV